jgi:uncharacterized membrane protein
MGLSPLSGLYRDRFGRVRLIETDASYTRTVNRAFDKTRQSARGISAVIIRLLDSLSSIVSNTTSRSNHVSTLTRQSAMILKGGEDSVIEANDLEDIHNRFRRMVALGVATDAASELSKSV